MSRECRFLEDALGGISGFSFLSPFCSGSSNKGTGRIRAHRSPAVAEKREPATSQPTDVRAHKVLQLRGYPLSVVLLRCVSQRGPWMDLHERQVSLPCVSRGGGARECGFRSVVEGAVHDQKATGRQQRKFVCKLYPPKVRGLACGSDDEAYSATSCFFQLANSTLFHLP